MSKAGDLRTFAWSYLGGERYQRTIAGPVIRRGSNLRSEDRGSGTPHLRGIGTGKGVYTPAFKLYLIWGRVVGRTLWDGGGRVQYRRFKADPSTPALVDHLRRFDAEWMEQRLREVAEPTPRTWLARCRAVLMTKLRPSG